MTFSSYWYKAVGFSCAAHLIFILLLAVVMGHIDRPLPLPEQYLAVEFAEITNGSHADNVPATAAVAQVTSPVDQPRTSTVRTAAATGIIHSPAARAATVAVTATAGAAGLGGEGPAVQGAAVAMGPAAAVKPAGGGDLDSIINDFLSQIEQHKDYPYIARRRGQEGTVTVAVRLSAAGELAGAQVIGSSGITALDEAALTLVRKVCPFVHNAGRSIAMNIPIAYQIK